tara:strand:- start:27 stop:293 length:267 start_codon:yes stop_codon:yes gene_type:complete
MLGLKPILEAGKPTRRVRKMAKLTLNLDDFQKGQDIRQSLTSLFTIELTNHEVEQIRTIAGSALVTALHALPFTLNRVEDEKPPEDIT